MIYQSPSGGGSVMVANLENGGAGEVTETYDYNNRLQLVRMQLAPNGSTNDIACAVYNYYPSVTNPTSCAIPSQGTGDDGNVIGHFD